MKFIVTNISTTYLTIAGEQLNHGQSVEIEAESAGAILEELRMYKMHGIVSIEPASEVVSARATPAPGTEVPCDEE